MYSQIYLPPRPRLFVKGEIRIEKGDFGGVLKGLESKHWTLFGNQPPHPPTFGKNLPKKRFFGGGLPLTNQQQVVLFSIFLCFVGDTDIDEDDEVIWR